MTRAAYFRARRADHIRLQLCVNNPKHGAARFMRTTCQACADLIAKKNARLNPRRRLKRES